MRIFVVIIFCFLSRLIPHPPNFTAVFAFSLWLGLHFRKQPQFCLFPLSHGASRHLSGRSGTGLIVYANLLATQWIERTNSDKSQMTDVGLKSFLSSSIFFLTVNFSVWRMSGMCPMNAEGLLACYVSTLPFYANQFIATFLFKAIFEKVPTGNWLSQYRWQTSEYSSE